MPTNLAIDDKLIEEAQRVGHHKTKKDTVTTALREYVKLQQRRAMLDEEGQVEFWHAFDHKSLRRDRSRP